MILHALVDVEIGATRGIESGKQLVHHDQKLHVGGFILEQALGLLLVSLGLAHPRFGVDVFQQFGIGVIDKPLVRIGVRASVFRGDVFRLRIVRGDYRTPAFEYRFLEQREILAGLVNTGCHQDGIAPVVAQSRFVHEVENNIVYHPFHTRF